MNRTFSILASLFVLNFAFAATDIENILRKACTSVDSSGYYFSRAKRAIKTPKDEAEYYFSKNVRFTNYGTTDSAIIYGKIAERKFLNLRDTTKLIRIYNNFGKIYQRNGKYELAIAYLFKGLKLAESKHDEKWMGNLCINLGLNYHDFADFKNGIKYGKQGYQHHVIASKTGDAYLIALALNTIAINFDDWNKPDSALYYHFRIFDYKNRLDTLSISFTYNNIGNTLMKQRKFSQAKSWIERAVKIAKINCRQLDDNAYAYENATNFINLATIEFELGNYSKAEQIFKTAYMYVTKSKDIEKLRDYNLDQYLFNKKRKHFAEAIEYQDKYFNIRDSIFNQQRAKAVAELETKYQTEKKERELIQSRAKIIETEAKRKQIMTWLLFSVLMIIVLGFIAYFVYRQQRLRLAQQQREFLLKAEINQIETKNKLQEQRLTISRDLHDNIGSQLTYIISSINNLRYRLKEDEKVSGQLDKIGQFASDTISELRDTIWAVNSNSIKFDDLRVRIYNAIEKAKQAKPDIQIDFRIDEQLEGLLLTAFVGLNIFRTIQEIVNNALKYADATAINIEILSRNNLIEIIAGDNGNGFDVEAVSRGNGLNNMAKRMEDIGGNFLLESKPSEGTHITISIDKEKLF